MKVEVKILMEFPYGKTYRQIFCLFVLWRQGLNPGPHTHSRQVFYHWATSLAKFP